MTMVSAPLRLGLIGAGRWGRNYVPTIGALDGVRLVRLADPDPACRALVDGSCRVTADWREVAEADDLDGVIVATPPALHATMTKTAVAAGRAVLVEKPLTVDAAEAAVLSRFVTHHGGYVMVEHTHLFNPAFRKLKELAGGLGPVREIHGEAGNHGPYRTDAPVLWDWGPHDVAMCLDLLGVSPEKVAAERMAARPVGTIEGEILDIRLEFPEAVTAAIRIGNILDKRRRFTVRFDDATLVFDDLADAKLLRRPGEPVPVAPQRPLSVAVTEFAAAIRSGARDTASLDLGVAVTQVLARCQTVLEGGAEA